MTVSTTTNRIPYTGDGVSVAFTVPFLFLANADIAVYVNGVKQTTGFTTTGQGAGAGTVTFVTAPVNGALVVLVRDPDLLQSTALTSNGPFPADSVERMSDKAMIGLQRFIDIANRALVLNDGDAAATLTLPLLATRASKFLAFDASGLPIAAAGATGLPATAIGTALLAAVNAAAARGVLLSGVTGDALFLTATAAAARTVLASGATGDALFLTATAAAARALLAVAPRATRVDVATAATLDITGSAPDSDDTRSTGSVTVTAVNLTAGRVVRMLAGASYTITNAGNISCVGGTSIVARAGDMVTYRATALNTVEVSVVRATPIVIGTATVTTSGTSVDVTGIPTDAKAVHIALLGVSTSGTSPLMVRLGTSSGGVESSGYSAQITQLPDAAATAIAVSSAGFPLAVTGNAVYALVGLFTLRLINASTNTWVAEFSGNAGTSSVALVASGSKALSSILDRIRLTTAGGVDTFDAGSITVSYES